MVRVYLDEDVSVLFASLLKARSIDAVTAREENMLGAEDEAHLKKCIELKRILLSHNRTDFEELYASYIQSEISIPGIIILTRQRDIFDLAKRITKFFAEHPDISNQLWYL